MPALKHVCLRHGTRLAFEEGRLVRVTGAAGDEQVALAWEGDALVGLEVPARSGGAPVLVRGEGVAHMLFGTAHPVMVGRDVTTWMGAVDWAGPERIPPIEQPGRLPGGAGTTILNTLARLAEQAGVAHLRYAGPYPTAALWQSLLQSFRPDPAADEATFTAGALERAARADMSAVAVDLAPAPFERVQLAPGVVAQLRDGVERVQVGGDAYATGTGVRRLVPIDDGGATLAAEVWLAGGRWARVATVDAGGALVDGPTPVPPPEGDPVGAALPATLLAALAPLVGEQLAPPLAAVAGDVLAGLRVEWGDAGAAAARDRGDRVVVHAALWQRLAPRGLAEVALALAEALAAPVAARAQARLAAAITVATACALAVLAPGCGAPPATTATPSHRPVGTPAVADPPALPLLADTLPADFDRRARLLRFDRVFLDDGAPVARNPDNAGRDREEYIVVEERGDRVRLRVDDVWARVLVWVERDQLRPTLVRDVVAGGHDRPLAPDARIALHEGAPLRLGHGTGRGGIPVTVDDEFLIAYATVPAGALGEVWRAPPPDDSDGDDEPARGPPPGAVLSGTEILDAPIPGGQVLGRVELRLAATEATPNPVPGWHRVTLDTEYISITGYVPDRAWTPGGGIMVGSEISPTDRSGVELVAGTCLYARRGGPLVGAVLVTQHDAVSMRGGWARWEWTTWWGRIPLYARPTPDGFERCPGTLPPDAAATGGE